MLNSSRSGHGLVVEYVLAKDESRVRFPLPALNMNERFKPEQFNNPNDPDEENVIPPASENFDPSQLGEPDGDAIRRLAEKMKNEDE